MPQINGIGVPPLGPQTTETDDSRLFQKYTAGARWYPLRRVAIDASGYYKRDDYNYNNPTDVTANDITSVDRYPAYLVAQNFETYDASLRLTLRPWRNVNLVSRYEHQWSTVLTTPDAISTLPQVESSSLDSHILGQDVGWSPWSRLYLQAGFTYVLSKTTTPGADAPLAVTPTIPGVLPSQNDYWMLNFSSTFVLNDKTDLNLGYFYYRANNHYDNAAAGVLYGSDAQEHSLSASVVYRMRHNIRLILRYGYSHYDDVAFGGQRNYEAHVVSTSLQYRF